MKVATKVSYGIRFMLFLALEHPIKYVRLTEIAKTEKMSIKFLENIASTIKPLGILDVKRGVKGGYRLSVLPQEICLYDLFRVLDSTFLNFENIQEETTYKTFSQVVVKNVFSDLKITIEEYLKSKTLADLMKDYQMLYENKMFFI